MIRIRTAVPADLPAIERITAASPTAPQWTAAQFRESLVPSTSEAVRRTVLIADTTEAGSSQPALSLSKGLASDQDSDQAPPHAEGIGFAILSAVVSVYPVEAELESIAVDPVHRGCGAGAALLRAAERWLTSLAPAADSSVLRLEVRASNAAALRLYLRSGFRATATRRAYYTNPTEDAICMEKTPTQATA